ncbi:MAG: cell division protein FtsQ/DivIB [Candidatus Heteroscillospira sp.]|jgi:hypothetical protein
MPDTQENRPRSQQRRRRSRNPLPFVFVCAAIVLFMSLLFRVSGIEVVGSTVYTDGAIISASGIQEGDSLFFINRSSAASRITSKLPAVDDAVIERVMPNKIRIRITESDSIAYMDVQGEFWSLDHSMRFLEKISSEELTGKIQIKGIQVESPIIGTQVSGDYAEEISTLMEIMGGYGMLPYVTGIELSGEDKAEFDYMGRFTVRIALTEELDYQVQKALSAVSQLSPGDRALLDLTIDDKVHYIPR